MALIDKASLLFVPSVVAQEKAFNILPSGNRAPDSTGENSGYDQTRADFDFDRGSNAAATRVNADGLIEKYRENLLLNTNVFNSGVWLNDDTTETSGFEGYDGTNNAWKLVGNTNASRHHIVQSISQGGVNAWSLYAKASGHNYIQFGSGSTVHQYVNFDLSDGSVGNIGSDFFSANAEDVGDGWYRLSVVDKGSTNGFYISLVSSKTAGWLESWAMPNATDGILIQNAQLESGLVSTDYLESTSVTGKAGVLIDLPRIDYSSGAGALLLEPQRTNVLDHSEYFDAWIKSSISVVSNAGISPEGIQNATTIDVVSAASFASLRRNISVSANSTYTMSLFVKKETSETNYMGLGFVYSGGTTDVGYVIIDSVNGTAVSADPRIDVITNVVDFGDYWRIEATATDSGSNNSLTAYIYGTLSTNGTNVAVGTGSTRTIWGAQLEAGSYATSYIPNHGESGGVTRAADSCSVTGASDVIGQTEGTIYAEFEIDNLSESGNEKVLFYMKDTGTGERYLSFVNNGSLTYIESNGAVIANISKTGLSVGSYKAAIAYKANDFAFYLNGEQVGTDNAGTPSGFSTFGFQYYNSAVSGKQFAKQTAVFKERLSNAELAALTA